MGDTDSSEAGAGTDSMAEEGGMLAEVVLDDCTRCSLADELVEAEVVRGGMSGVYRYYL